MKCEFDSTNTVELIRDVVFCVLFFLGCGLVLVNVILGVSLVIVGMLLMIVLPGFLCRQINLSDEKLDISYNFFTKSILLNDIVKAECTIKTEGQRGGDVIYKLVLNLQCKSGKEYKYMKILYDVEKDYPVQHADKFKRYVDEQPMMKMCNMINDRL